jgi:hypothetical protein
MERLAHSAAQSSALESGLSDSIVSACAVLARSAQIYATQTHPVLVDKVNKIDLQQSALLSPVDACVQMVDDLSDQVLPLWRFVQQLSLLYANVIGSGGSLQSNFSNAPVFPTTYTDNRRLDHTAAPSLGYALAQLHGAYVLAQNEQGLVIVDMHAAHERIVYEQLKAGYAQHGVATQQLLVPWLCKSCDISVDTVAQYGALFLQLGLSFVVREQQVYLEAIPAMLAKKDLSLLVQSVVGELLQYQATDHIQVALHKIFATMACHSAIRANRV